MQRLAAVQRKRFVAAAWLLAAAACTRELPPANHPPAPPPSRPAASVTASSSATASTPAPKVEAPAPLPDDPAERLAEAQKRLRRISNFEAETIPEAAQPLLAAIKQASIALIAREVDRVAAAQGDLADVPAHEIEAAIEAAARSAGVVVTDRTITAPDNGTWHPSVTRSQANPRFLVIGYYYAVPCGFDAGYAIYELAGGAARLLMTLSSPNADSIEPMFWELAFALSPPATKDFFFVATRVTPWCQSALRRLQIMVLRPGKTPDQPERLVDEEVSYHLKGEYGLRVNAAQVTLTFTPEPANRQVRRWRIGAVRATRVTP